MTDPDAITPAAAPETAPADVVAAQEAPAAPWPRYRGWPIFVAYALLVGAGWLGLNAATGFADRAPGDAAEAGWLSGLIQRIPESDFKIFLAILAIAALSYAAGQLLILRGERRWLVKPYAKGPGGWTMLFARPAGLYAAAPNTGNARLRDHIQFGLEDALAPLSAMLWAFPMLGFLGTIAGLSDAVARLPAALESDDVGSVLDGLHLAFDTTMIGLLATLLLYPVTVWIDQARAPLIKACQDLEAT